MENKKIEIIEKQNPQEKVEEMAGEYELMKSVSEDYLEISSKEDYEEASQFLLEVKKRIKKIDKVEKEYLKPLEENVKKLKKVFREPKKKFQKIEGEVKDSIAEYLREEDKKAREKEKEIKKEFEKKKKKEDKMSFEITPSAKRPQTKIKSERGTVSSSERIKFEITDVHALPEEIKRKILEKAVSRNMAQQFVRPIVKRDGMDAEINGVRVYKDYTVSARA